MAQLKDTIIQGDARVTDTLYANELSIVNSSMKLLSLINTGTLSAVSIANGINFGSAATTVGHIGAETDSLGIYSLGAIAISPNTSISGTSWLYDTGIKITSTQVIPAGTVSLGASSAKWSDLYATLISPDKVRINTTSSRDENLYVNGSARFYLGTSPGVADKSFTIAAGASGHVYSLSIAGQGIQEYNDSSEPAILYIQSRGGDLSFGPASSVSTTAYSFKPGQNNQHNLGSSSYKWANIYSTTATLNGLSVVGGDIVMSEASGHGATHKLIFQRGTATDGYTNWKLYNNSVGVLILQAYHNGLDADTDILQVLCPTTSQTPALVPGTTNSYDIGSSSLVWRNIYATNLYGALATSDLTGQVAIANGGTGASDAANARTNLGLGTIAVKDTDDYYNIGGGGTVVSSTQDFDTLTDFGNYYRTANSDTTNMTHIPQKQAFTLKIMSASGSNSRIRQVFQPYNKNIIYMRNKGSATDAAWTAWQYQPVVTPAENDGTYTLTKGSASLPVYVDNNGEIQPITSLSINDITASSSFIFSGMASNSTNLACPVWFTYAADTSTLTNGKPAYNDNFKYNPNTDRLIAGVLQTKAGANASTFTVGLDFIDSSLGRRGHVGASTTAGDVGIYSVGNIYLRPSCTTASGATTLTSSYGVIISSTSLYPASTSNVPSLGNSTNKWSNIYTELITPNTATYTTTTTAGIVFYNSSALCGHIGSSTGGAAPGSIGLQTTGQITFRAGATLSSNVLDGDSGINFSSTGFVPKTNAAALDTTGALTLGSNTAQWTTTYTKQLTVDQHVTLAYNSSDLSLNFNFS